MNNEKNLAKSAQWDDKPLSINGRVIKKGSYIHFYSGGSSILKLENLSEEDEISFNNADGGVIAPAYPGYGTWIKPSGSNKSVSCTFRPKATDRGNVDLVVISKEILMPLEVFCYVASENLGESVGVLLNEQHIPSGGADVDGEVNYTVKLEYFQGDFAKHVPLKLEGVEREGLELNDVKIEPSLFSKDHVWKIAFVSAIGSLRFKLSNEQGSMTLTTPQIRVRPNLENAIMFCFHGDSPITEFLVPVGAHITFGVSLKSVGGHPLTYAKITTTTPADPTGFIAYIGTDGTATSGISSDKPIVGYTFNVLIVAEYQGRSIQMQLPARVVAA